MYSDIMDTIGYVKSCDPEVGAAMEKELIREQNTIELIASENIVSPAVMCAMGSVLTNKYAEGYPGKRYYGGCFAVDEAEDIARERARELFGAEYVNVQPHSGAQANLAAYQALLTPGDRVLGMSLDAGGHLTHGAKFNESGKLYQFECYGVDDDGFLDYEALEAMAKEYQPKLIVAGASAYPRVFDYERLRKIADSVDALLMVDMAHVAGLVAGGVHPSPIPWAHVVTTTTHKTLRGPRGGMILAKEEFGKALNRAIFPGTQGGPLMHIIASKAVCLGEALKPEFKAYAEQVVKNAAVLAEELMAQGAKLVSGGTDNHLILLDTRSFGITGKDLEERLEASGITVNKNSIPNDPEKTTITSGIRIGTPAATTRGMKEDDMRTIATCIVKVAQDFEKNSAEVQETVKALLAKYPLYE